MSTPVTIGIIGEFLTSNHYNNQPDIIVRDGVTGIQWDLFKGVTSLRTIVIPNSVTSLSANMFYGCSE